MTIDRGAEVLSAVAVLNASYEHDDPEKWLRAYQTLRTARDAINRAVKAYDWLRQVGYALMIPVVVLIIYQIATLAEFWPEFGLVIPATMLPVAIAEQLARRREPLVKHRGAIEEACNRFDARAASLTAKHEHAPT